MSIEDELLEIENYIKTLDLNDNTNQKINEMIKDGTSKGLIYDFINEQQQYRGTMFSTKIIKQEEYDDFQKYINRCQIEEQNAYRKWKQDIIDSGVEFSKDELKYYKLI
jgi:hypothetical protein